MHDEVAGDDEIRLRDFLAREVEQRRVEAVDAAIVENIELYRGSFLGLCGQADGKQAEGEGAKGSVKHWKSVLLSRNGVAGRDHGWFRLYMTGAGPVLFHLSVRSSIFLSRIAATMGTGSASVDEHGMRGR
jgi:hypothetical protein